MTETRGTFQSPEGGTSRLVLNGDVVRRRARMLGARTDDECCALLNISRATFHRWRRGRAAPSYDRLRGMARRLDLTVEDLLTEVPG